MLNILADITGNHLRSKIEKKYYPSGNFFKGTLFEIVIMNLP